MYLSKYDLSGRIAFVTGGGRGIGLSAAEALLEAGAEVIISDIDPSLLEQAKASLSGKGAVDTLVLDITDWPPSRPRRKPPMHVMAASTSSSRMPASPGPTRQAKP